MIFKTNIFGIENQSLKDMKDFFLKLVKKFFSHKSRYAKYVDFRLIYWKKN